MSGEMDPEADLPVIEEDQIAPPEQGESQWRIMCVRVFELKMITGLRIAGPLL